MTRQSAAVEGFGLYGSEPGASPADVVGVAATEWVPALVPGGVHESLRAAGLIPDPYLDRNEDAVRWVEDRAWWFRAGLPPLTAPPGARTSLVCHGLDTVADAWLVRPGGEMVPLGHHENMFTPATFALDADLAGAEVLIRFNPPLAGLEPPAPATELTRRLGDAFAALAPEPDPDAVQGEVSEPAEATGLMSETLPLATLRRKATFSWGWDFGPRLPSVGPWRPVELVVESGAVITGHHVRTDAVDLGARTAEVSILVEADRVGRDLTDDVKARVELVSPSGGRTEVEVALTGVERLSGRADVVVTDAEPWWTHDLGTPSRYTVTITLLAGEDVQHEITDSIGLRTIMVDRSPDPEGGQHFTFVLNGVPVFARGAAWLPADMLVGSVDHDRYRDLITTARDGNMTMLRVWGGGIYEQDVFYQLCDELGVLVWQDFMFACMDYPSDDPALRAEVEQEAAYQVRRLRNRACLGLWSGNNEVQLIHGFGYQGYEPGNWGYGFFHDVLPAAVAAHDGGVPYWPGSPWGENETEGFMAVNGVLDGDRHAWEVWHGLDFGAGGGDFASVGESRLYRRYANDRGKFISEFGIHAAPELTTLGRWIPADQLSVHSAGFDHHNKDHPKNKHDAVLEIVTGLPETVQEYVDFTMISQAEGLKFGIEHYRRRSPHCSGTLVWQFNDVWPGFSWSVVDYQGIPKAGYHFAKRAFAPILASFAETPDGDLQLWVANSTAAAVEVTAEVSLAPFGGPADRVELITAAVPAGSSALAWTAPAGTYERSLDRYAWVRSPDDGFAPNRCFFGEVKDLALAGSVTSTVDRTGPDSATVRVTASGFAYFVRIPTPAAGVRFSDNFLDLRDRDTAEITVTGLTADITDDQLWARCGLR